MTHLSRMSMNQLKRNRVNWHRIKHQAQTRTGVYTGMNANAIKRMVALANNHIKNLYAEENRREKSIRKEIHVMSVPVSLESLELYKTWLTLLLSWLATRGPGNRLLRKILE
jgi:CRISPR/Cas system CSM-associated protein Csm2 small subunit